jgi:hypothetical protein
MAGTKRTATTAAASRPSKKSRTTTITLDSSDDDNATDATTPEPTENSSQDSSAPLVKPSKNDPAHVQDQYFVQNYLRTKQHLFSDDQEILNKNVLGEFILSAVVPSVSRPGQNHRSRGGLLPATVISAHPPSILSTRVNLKVT